MVYEKSVVVHVIMDWELEYNSELKIARIIFKIDGRNYILPLEETVIKSIFHI